MYSVLVALQPVRIRSIFITFMFQGVDCGLEGLVTYFKLELDTTGSGTDTFYYREVFLFV
jgi:hypothetical protein